MKYFFTFLIFFSFLYSLSGQEKNIYIKKQSSNFEDLIKNLEKEEDIRFFYHLESIPDFTININEDSVLLNQYLSQTLAPLGIRISTDLEGNYFLMKGFVFQTDVDDVFNNQYIKSENIKGKSKVQVNDSEYIKSSQKFISENIFIGSKGFINKKQKVIISGIVSDDLDKSPVYQAKVRIEELDKFLLTNRSGYFEFELKPGVYTFYVSSLGMYEKTYKVTLQSDGQLNIPLQPKLFALDEITISANQNDNVKSTTMGFEKVTAKSIKELPSILGERDIVKVALLLPGVQTIGELSSGFNVRGSPADQNIFYINDLPIYNSSHVFGLFTSFNGDAINEFNFYKSNLPIEYGGHLSSIFDIKTKKGNSKHFSARGGIGPTSGRILVEGPLKKDSSSYLISLRSSYSDWLLNLIDNPDINNSSISFYDALFDISTYIGKKDKLDLFFYNSNDLSDLAFGVRNQYSNLGSSLKWTHVFNEKFKSELSLLKSRYFYDEENYEIEYLGYKHSFDLNHNEAKLKFIYNINQNHLIRFGLNSKYYKLNFGDFTPLNEESSIKPIQFESEQATSNSFFLGDKWDISDNLSIEGGIRFTNYIYMGAKTIFAYEDNAPRVFNNIIDSVIYGKNDHISTNSNLDYRFSTKFQLTGTSSIKASYNLLHQYVFMLSNTVSVSPTNNWKLSDPHLDPMRGEQFSFGLYKNFPKNSIETSVELYYKEVGNLVEYKDGANFLANQLPETNIIQGDLKSSGVEIMLKKKSGKLNGWINYTYSKALVKVIDQETGEMNNQGLEYSANYDRPHAMNLTMNYRFSRRISVSTNIVYSSGRPVTYPTSIYYLNDIEITGFSKRNEYRIPDYFRTDLSINIEGNLKKYKFAHSFWSIGFYNLTARKNPYSIIFQNEFGKIKGYKISILGTVIPSITYNLKFGNFEN